MSAWPCRNQSCNSFGKPHPNCLCGPPSLAKGGKVEGFCAKDGAHNRDCQFFQDGGEAINPDEVVVAAPPTDDIDPAQVAVDQPVDHPTEIKADEVNDVTAAKDYGSTGQQILTGIEGAAEGVAGGIAPFAEHHLLGEPYEAIAARAEANPWTHGLAQTGAMAASMMAGVGIAGRIAQGAGALTKAANLGRVGAAIMNGAITNGLLQASDEASKWIMGQGNQEDAAGAVLAHVGLSSVLGGVFGAAGVQASKGLTKLAESRLGERAEFFLHGLAAAADSGGKTVSPNAGLERGLSESAERGFMAGQKAYNAITGKLLPATLGAGAEGYAGYKKDGLIGGAEGAARGAWHGILAGLIGKGLGATYGKIAAPAAAWALAHGGHGLLEALDHGAKAVAGSEAISKAVDSAFKAGTASAISGVSTATARKKIHEWVERGGTNQELLDEKHGAAPTGFAHGGQATLADTDQHDAIAKLYPQQNVLIQAAKGRMFNYLNGLRPGGNQPRLPFDRAPDTRQQQKTYDRALDIAASPLSIMHAVNSGRITPSDVAHFRALHPEIDGLLQKRLTERILRSQMSGEKPSFKVRQGLSLLMGTALSAEFTPQSIAAAQAVFRAMPQPDPNQPQDAPKKNTSKLSKSSQAFLTDDQSREKRQQRV